MKQSPLDNIAGVIILVAIYFIGYLAVRETNYILFVLSSFMSILWCGYCAALAKTRLKAKQ